MRLFQIPISHNCLKIRWVLERKGLAYDTVDIVPIERKAVIAASGQALTPALEDGDEVVADSTAILHYLERTYPDPPLLPAGQADRAECWLLEDWSDRAWMALTRRLAYWSVIHRPGMIAELFFPKTRGLKRRITEILARRAVTRRFGLSAERNRRDEVVARELAALAVDRLGGRPYLVGDAITLADVTLATMTAPVWAAAPEVTDDVKVRALLEWGQSTLGAAYVEPYKA